MNNFEEISTQGLHLITGGVNEMTDKCTCEDCIV